MGSRQTYSNQLSGPSHQQIKGERRSAAEVTPTNSGGKQVGVLSKKSKSNYDQDFSGAQKGGGQNMINMTSSSGNHTKYGVSNDDGGNQLMMDVMIDVEPNQSHHWTNGDIQDRAIDEVVADMVEEEHNVEIEED